MAVTSGVRAIRAHIVVDGVQIPVEDLSVSLPSSRKSATWSASTAVSALPDSRNEDYWASQNPKEIDCVISINGAVTTVLVGVLDSAGVPLAETKIHFSGRDLSAKLHEKKSREKFRNKKPEEIIQDLASRVGLTAQVDSFGLKAGKLVQIDWDKLALGHSYSEILNHFCDLVGARWWIDKKTLHVKKDAQSGVYTVNFKRTVPQQSDGMRITVSRNYQSARPAKVTTHGWSTEKKDTVKSTANVSGVGDTVEYVYSSHGISPEHAASHAKGKAKEHARHEFTVNAELPGDLSIVRASKLGLRGNAWAGDYDIDSIGFHVSSGGFQMTVSAKSAKKGRTVS